MSALELDAAINRMRSHVLRRAASNRRLAIPSGLESLVIMQADGQVWSTILKHNVGLIGTLRRIPLIADALWTRFAHRREG